MTASPSTTRMTVRTEGIGPSEATRILERNTANRPVRDRVVRTYARDMKAGRWRQTGEAIKISASGALLDGQHRLWAIIESGATLPLMVVRGVDPEAQQVMDTGAKRSVHDHLHFKGKQNTRVLAAAARLALTEPGAGFVEEAVENPSPAEIEEFIDAHEPGISEAASRSTSYIPDVPMIPSVLAVAWMRMVAIDPDAAREFWDAIKEQRTHGTGDPRLALSKRLHNAKMQRSRIPQRQMLSLVFRSWNAWRRGVSMRSIGTHVRGEEVPIPSVLR